MHTFIALLALASSAAFADNTPGFTTKDPVYLSKQAVSVSDILSAPPAAHSADDTADINEILAVQGKRSDAECDRAKTEVKVTLETFFGPQYGPLTADQVKRWTPFFEQVRNDTNYFVQEAKHQWKRPRPYLADSRVHPCTPLEKTDAYPSGHATISRVYADVLSLMDPSHKAQYEARADQIAHDRVLAGVHHPSDIAAGKKLGDAIFKTLEKSEKFEKDLKSAEAAKE